MRPQRVHAGRPFVHRPEHVAEVVQLEPRRTLVHAVLVSLRPRQWIKNLLVFAGIVFAAEFGDPGSWAAALTVFVAYCAASSAAYLINDVRDAGADRMHPSKRRRPVARGEVSSQAAGLLAALLAAAAIGMGASLGPESLACLVGFVLLQLTYTLKLKEIVLIDVFAIAALFVLRATAGALAVDVPISPWLLACTGLLALFLALGKRRAELVLVESGRAPGRAVLAGYSVGLVDQLVAIVAAATIASYVVYALTARDTQVLAATIPFVVYGVFRYLVLARRGAGGEEPENVLLTDVPLLVTVGGWAALCAVLLAAG
jgi:4-hydroxybenzoate polyprenyltransferase